MTKACEVGHVQAQGGPESDHSGQRWNEDDPKLTDRVKLALLCQQITQAMGFPDCPREQKRRHDQHEWRGPILDFAKKIHAAVNDEDVQAPENKKRQPLSAHVIEKWSTQQIIPTRNNYCKQSVKRFAAYPGLNSKPTARDDRAH